MSSTAPAKGLNAPPLADLQQEFFRALRDPDAPAPQSIKRDTSTASSRRFDVYRNNIVVGLLDALKATFPAIHRLVGEEYFAAVARVYIGRYPPQSPVLMFYGDNFGEFLEQFPSASDIPYLGDVARLEWAWIQAHHAPDAEPVQITELAGVPETLLESVTFALHPSLAVVCSRWPVVSLVRVCRTGQRGKRGYERATGRGRRAARIRCMCTICPRAAACSWVPSTRVRLWVPPRGKP